MSLDPQIPIRDPEPRRLRSSVLDVEGVAILRLHGEIDAGEVNALRSAFDGALRVADGLLVLDLEEVSFLDTTALSAIIDSVREAEQVGCAVSVVSASERVRRVVTLTGNDSLLEPPSSLVDVAIAASIEQAESAAPHG